MVISRISAISKAASLAPQLMSMLLAVLPVTECQGLFHQRAKKQGEKITSGQLRCGAAA
jgi:hypothetical protein